MLRPRLILLAVLAGALAGCAVNPEPPALVYPQGHLARPNTQPKTLPCMIGDQICTTSS